MISIKIVTLILIVIQVILIFHQMMTTLRNQNLWASQSKVSQTVVHLRHQRVVAIKLIVRIKLKKKW
jgi:hypothetical protein